MVDPNIILQGGRLESGSDADVCRSWLFQDFEKQDLDIVVFHSPACYNIHPQLGFPTSQVEDMTFQISHGSKNKIKGNFESKSNKKLNSKYSSWTSSLNIFFL